MQPKLHDVGHATVVKRVSRRGHDEVHGGAWKVAFADFCLALLCLFLVLWLLASRNAERMQVVMKSAGANLLEDGQGMSDTMSMGTRGSMIDRFPVPARSEDASAGEPDHGARDPRPYPQEAVLLDSPQQLGELAQRIERIAATEGLSGNLQTTVTAQGLRLQLHDTEANGMFERGGIVPSRRMRTLLHRLGPVFAQVRNRLLVTGHTDATAYSDKTPGAFSNWGLSTQRAMAARYELLAGGMPEASVLQVSGMADTAPVDAADTKAPANRRIELMVLTSAQSRAITAMYGPTAGGVSAASLQPASPALAP
ncbi:flagellar motor protein MotB [Roseateles sp. BYS78W]|uniref:Flagellar motor protein MotB n=1 Tax=Pelomonas candidula TaxID=3299025 RepID=A0ABW7HGE5_9BURK